MVNEELKTEVVANWMERFTKEGQDKVTGTEADHVEFLLEAIERVARAARTRCAEIAREQFNKDYLTDGYQIAEAIEKGEAV